MTVQCFTGKHLHWSGFIGVPLLVLTGLFMPLVTLAILMHHRRALDLTAVRLRYGFIYRPYRYVSLSREGVMRMYHRHALNLTAVRLKL